MVWMCVDACAACACSSLPRRPQTAAQRLGKLAYALSLFFACSFTLFFFLMEDAADRGGGRDALLLARQAGQLLLLPASVTATALAFIHGWEAARGDVASSSQPDLLPPLPPPRLAAAALLLAGKADHAGVAIRTNDLVNAVACVSAAGGEWTALAGRPYAAAKAALLADEALLLRALRFQVAPGADGPTRVALNAAAVLGRSKATARGAAALCADAAALTALPLSAGPVTTAAAALLVAGLATGEEKEEDSNAPRRPDGVTPVRWWEALGARTEGMLEAVEEVVGMLEREAGGGEREAGRGRIAF